jgi:hypothetical protein
VRKSLDKSKGLRKQKLSVSGAANSLDGEKVDLYIRSPLLGTGRFTEAFSSLQDLRPHCWELEK